MKLACIILCALGGLFAADSISARRQGGPTPVVYRPRLPRGIPAALWRKFIPADNPMSEAKVALGRALFFDPRLSADGTVSCATCHSPTAAFTDRKAVAVGVNGRRGGRNAPTILNAMFNHDQFWDGRSRTLEAQARAALFSPTEMGMESPDLLAVRLSAVAEYRQKFRRAFGGDRVTADAVVKAIAAFERTQLSGDSPFDRHLAGESGAITEAQGRGWQLFRSKAQCIACHQFTPALPLFTDFKFHNTGVAARTSAADQPRSQVAAVSNAVAVVPTKLGRFAVTGQWPDVGAFKTPGLRNVELTAPYMHDGSEETLAGVVRFYNRGGHRNAGLDVRVRPLLLTEGEVADIVEFLKALTDDEARGQSRPAAAARRHKPGPVR